MPTEPSPDDRSPTPRPTGGRSVHPGRVHPYDEPRWRWHGPLVAALFALAAALAITSLLGDSITYDETSHLTAGMSYLKTGDFRLAPDHPPLAKLWAAWPLLLVDRLSTADTGVGRYPWPPPETPGWQVGDVYRTGRTWLFELNDGERLIVIPRCMMVLLLLGLCGATYAAGRRLFGPSAGLLALALAALSPTLLAHGRLVTTDVPIALCIALVLLLFSRLLERPSAGRFLATAAALGAASVSKFSWPLIVPALMVMGVAALVSDADDQAGSRLRRAGIVLVIALGLATTTYASIWTCYGWRTSMFPDPGPAHMGSADPTIPQAAETVAAHWHRTLHDEQGQPRRGPVAAFVRWAARYHLLPDAYLFGLAWTLQSTAGRSAYFCGQTSATGGWIGYFPLAFAIKTPVPTMLLMLAGIVAVALRRCACRDRILLWGLLAYIAVHTAYVMTSNFNIGHRHLLPIYAPLFVLAGASVAWLRVRAGRWLIGVAVAWLALVHVRTYPHYLSYFNELVGGPSRGHLYLADSNIDWGQDLKRLARYVRQRRLEPIKLSYFGSADPTRYGFECKLLPSSIGTGSPEHLDGGGTYVISVTRLLGVYEKWAQDSFWQQPGAAAEYRKLGSRLQSLARDQSPVGRELHERLAQRYARVRWGRFLYNLRRRQPDDRVGYSLFVYRLDPAEVDELTRP